MSRFNKYQHEHDEFLHPLWLGILILFSVIIILGLLCFMRKKCGSQIRHLFYVLCCGIEWNTKHHSKTPKQSSVTSPYNWTPVYNPPPNVSPKLYKLVRNIQMASLDEEPSIEKMINNDDNIETDVFSILDESDQVKASETRKISQSSQESNKKRNSEAARRFYASMRQSSECQNSSSLDSYNNEPSLATTDRLIKTNPNDKLKFFHTSRFFQSIGKNTH